LLFGNGTRCLFCMDGILAFDTTTGGDKTAVWATTDSITMLAKELSLLDF
jgi:hypothetical protein